MAMKITERLNIVEGVTPQDIVGGQISGYHNMAGIGLVLVIVITGLIAFDKKAAIQLMQAKDDQGTDAKVLGAPVEQVAGAGGETIFLTAEAKASDLDVNNGFNHVAAQVSSDNATAVNGAAIFAFGDLSFKG